MGCPRKYAVAITAEVYGKGTWPLDEALCLRVAREIGLDAGEFSALLEASDISSEIERSCLRAADRGVFGVPTCFVGESMFWGNDRLVLVEKALKQL